MFVAQHLTPTMEETQAFLEQQLHERLNLLQVAGEFEITYKGRAQSTAEAGDYLLSVKPDGCLMIHGARGIKPRNWQPTTDSISTKLVDGHVTLVAQRNNPLEVLEVRVLACTLVQALRLREETSFLLSGSEADMKAALKQNPEAIEAGLRIVDEELPTSVGHVDLFARDVKGNLVVIELKRGKATHEGVHQLSRYVQKVRALQGTSVAVRGVLVAPEATGPALKQLAEEGLEFRQLTALPELERENLQASLF